MQSVLVHQKTNKGGKCLGPKANAFPIGYIHIYTSSATCKSLPLRSRAWLPCILVVHRCARVIRPDRQMDRTG